MGFTTRIGFPSLVVALVLIVGGGRASAEEAALAIGAGAGVGERGVSVTAGLEAALGWACLSLRGERAAAGSEGTLLVGVSPGRSSGRAWAVVAGARTGNGAWTPATRTYALAGGRWTYGSRRGIDFVELAAVHIVDGRDRPHVKHSPLIPAWNLVVSGHLGPVVLAGETGITGLAYRGAEGDLRSEFYARARLSLFWGR